jgi:hypothetical protein
MKEQEKKPKSKQEFNRTLINKYLPYELWVFYKLRRYAQMQAAGELDIIDQIMFIEGISEGEAFQQCISLLKHASQERARIVEFVQDVTSRDVDLDIHHFRKN